MFKNYLLRLLREPLLHFCLIGGLIFIAFNLSNTDQEDTDNVITVASARLSQLQSQFESAWKRPPTAKELDNLVEGHIRQEVYYRSALSLELDRNDAVVRQRMQQKMEFLIDTGAYLEQPTPAELNAFFAANNTSYRQDPRLAIKQIYMGKHPDPIQLNQSLTLLNTDQNVIPGTLGERTFLPFHLTLSTPESVDAVFGKDFFKQLLELPQEKWSGPITSSFGLHLVSIVDRRSGRTPTLDEIHDQVLKDWQATKIKEIREEDYALRRSRFDIFIEPRDTTRQ